MADPATMAIVGLIGTAVSAGGTILGAQASANAAKANAQAESNALKQKAWQEQATAAVKARERRRKGEFLASRARAVSAASAGNASDPTVRNIVADINRESESQAQYIQWGADQTAENYRTQAKNVMAVGSANASAAQLAGITQAAGTILSGTSKYYDKFGSQQLALAPEKSTLEEFTWGGLTGYA